MKQKEYMNKVLNKINDNSQVKCEDCGEITKIGHAIVNHQDNNVKIVCDSCFKIKYQDF